MNEEYTILLEGAQAETELKKSRFIAHLKPVESVEAAVDFINEMKKQYYDARHNCYAYVIGKDGDTVKYSDDGEPAQTAGLPIYNVLKETQIRNAVIVVTRYFGGTLLGAGPLARMYKEAASLAVHKAVKGTMRYGIKASVKCDYSLGDKLKFYFEKEMIDIENVQYSDCVEYKVSVSFERFEKMREDIISISASRAIISKNSEGYFVDKL